MKTRCAWAADNPLCIEYHDKEWGVPVYDDQRLFESLVLGGAQAGLSWATILRRRRAYRDAFDGFDPVQVARYSRRKIDELLKNPGIVRNRLKIESAVANAQAFLKVQEEYGSFDSLIWRFVDGAAVVNRWKSVKQIPTRTRESDVMSKIDCFRYRELSEKQRRGSYEKGEKH